MLTKQEIRQLGAKEMKEELQKSLRELLKSQFDVRMGTSKEVHVMKNLKRYIARLKTIEKETAMPEGKKITSTKPEAVIKIEPPVKAKKSPVTPKQSKSASKKSSTEAQRPAKRKK